MGRLPSPSGRKYNIEKMWDVHHEIKRMILLGMKNTDIASALGITTAMVSYTRNSPLVKRELQIMQGAADVAAVDVAQRIKDLQPLAIEKLADLMESETESISIKAAMTILDRGGNAPVQKVQAEHLHGHFTLQEIQAIKERAKGALPIISEESPRLGEAWDNGEAGRASVECSVSREPLVIDVIPEVEHDKGL